MALFKAKCIVFLGHGENSILEIWNDVAMRFATLETYAVVADVWDAWRINSVLNWHRRDVVFRAAMHKYVPLMETNSEETLTSNAFDTRNVAQALRAESNAKSMAVRFENVL